MNILQKINSTLDSLKIDVEFVIQSNETNENQLKTIKQLFSKVS